MTRLSVVWMLAAVAPAFAAEPLKPEAAKAAAKKGAEAMGAATLKGNLLAVLDQTYEPAIQVLGGREQAEKMTRELMKQMDAIGFRVKSYTVEEPGDLHTEGDNTFVVVPTAMEMTTANGKMSQKGYLLGISPDAGKTWKFVDGTGLKNKAKRDKVLPKMPAALKLPEVKGPEMMKDK